MKGRRRPRFKPQIRRPLAKTMRKLHRSADQPSRRFFGGRCDRFEQVRDDLVRVNPFGFGMKCSDNAMSQNRPGDMADVSERSAANRPSSTARVLAARINDWPARGPFLAPHETHFFTSAEASEVDWDDSPLQDHVHGRTHAQVRVLCTLNAC